MQAHGERRNAREMDQDDFCYIRGISSNIQNITDDADLKIMADNVLETSSEKEIAFCTNSVSSKIVEQLLPFSSPETFEKFSTAIMPKLRLLENDSLGSFVIESSIKVATLRSLKAANKKIPEKAGQKRKMSKVSTSIDFNLNSEYKPDHSEYCQKLVIKLSRYLLNNLEECIKENNSNHFIRSCLLCLSGVISQKNNYQKYDEVNLAKQYGTIIPDEFSSMLAEFSERLLSWPQFPELAYEESSSVVLQTLLQSLKNVDDQKEMLKKLVKTIMKKSFKDETESDEPEDFTAFSSPATVHLLESMMDACEDKQLNKIYKKYFKAKLVELSKSPALNFAVQRLIDAMKSKEVFEEIFNSLSVEFGSLLQIGHSGVVLAICKSCERLGVKQGQFIQSLQKALDCVGDKTNKCIMPILSLTPLSSGENSEITLHGSLILQQIFHFNKPIKIVQVLLDMKPQIVANIFSDPKGSRIADAYLESKYIGEKSREKLIKHLEGMYLKLAMSKNGGFVLEKLYNLSSDTHKEEIVKELAERVNQLKTCVSGRVICYKFSVEAYAQSANRWKNIMARTSVQG